MEIRFGEFTTEVELPGPVLSEGIEAIYQNGFLRLVLPKASPARIKVE
jgi:HSP20 family molecular chaperone IbpA